MGNLCLLAILNFSPLDLSLKCMSGIRGLGDQIVDIIDLYNSFSMLVKFKFVPLKVSMKVSWVCRR